MSSPVEQVQGDDRAEELARILLDCLCTTLAEAGRAVCCCTWRRRERPVMPMACECSCAEGQGVAWMRIAERRYDRQVTRQNGFDGRACAVRFLEEWTVEVGVARCWAEDPESGKSCTEELEAAADGAWDEDLIMKALLCCDGMRPYNVVPQVVRTLGPQGACIAAVATVTVQPGPRPGTPYGYSL